MTQSSIYLCKQPPLQVLTDKVWLCTCTHLIFGSIFLVVMQLCFLMLSHHLILSLTIHSTRFSEGTFAMPVVKDRMVISLVITAIVIWCPKRYLEITFTVTSFTPLKVFLAPTSPENPMIKHNDI